MPARDSGSALEGSQLLFKVLFRCGSPLAQYPPIIADMSSELAQKGPQSPYLKLELIAISNLSQPCSRSHPKELQLLAWPALSILLCKEMPQTDAAQQWYSAAHVLAPAVQHQPSQHCPAVLIMQNCHLPRL